MAYPRVFISSTCFDLSEVRDGLVDFVKSFGFEPVLSERGDVFYHPDIHTQDSCLNEVSNCQLFILLIGGRFGGNYVADTAKSIVNAEYFSAKEKKIPIITFVKRNVYSDHHVFMKNRNNKLVKDIIFPSIENNDNASKIFSFIDEVRLAPTNNGYFPFDFVRDITSLLRKQWAGMFFEFLEERNSKNQFQTATNLLKNISIAGDKVEELVKSLYRHLDTTGADKKIDDVEKRALAREFYEEVFPQFVRERLKSNVNNTLATTPREGKWYEYIAKGSGGKVATRSFARNGEQKKQTVVIDWNSFGIYVDRPDDNEDPHHITSIKRQQLFDKIKSLSDKEVKDILDELSLFDAINISKPNIAKPNIAKKLSKLKTTATKASKK